MTRVTSQRVTARRLGHSLLATAATARPQPEAGGARAPRLPSTAPTNQRSHSVEANAGYEMHEQLRPRRTAFQRAHEQLLHLLNTFRFTCHGYPSHLRRLLYKGRVPGTYGARKPAMLFDLMTRSFRILFSAVPNVWCLSDKEARRVAQTWASSLALREFAHTNVLSAIPRVAWARSVEGQLSSRTRLLAD